jgi:hypothetical protein
VTAALGDINIAVKITLESVIKADQYNRMIQEYKQMGRVQNLKVSTQCMHSYAIQKNIVKSS